MPTNEMIERVVIAVRDSFNSNDIDCYPIAKAAIQAMKEIKIDKATNIEKG